MIWRRYSKKDFSFEGLLSCECVVGTDMTDLPFFHVKKTKNEKNRLSAYYRPGLKKDGLIRVAFSGLASFPFRDAETERILNNAELSFEQRARKYAGLFRLHTGRYERIAAYREFVLKTL
jgi:hypothetical protein